MLEGQQGLFVRFQITVSSRQEERMNEAIAEMKSRYPGDFPMLIFLSFR